MGARALNPLNRRHDLGKNAGQDEINLEILEKILWIEPFRAREGRGPEGNWWLRNREVVTKVNDDPPTLR